MGWREGAEKEGEDGVCTVERRRKVRKHRETIT